MLLMRPPRPALRPFVKTLWATDQASALSPSDRERVLPTGWMHLAFRVSDEPLRVFEDVSDSTGQLIGHATVGGARNTPYVRDTAEPACSVGALLQPGVSESLFDVPAVELAGRHHSLEEFWGHASVEVARERLSGAATPERRLELLESILSARLPTVRGLHPAVAHALDEFTGYSRIGDVVKQTGYSHRRFIALFGRAVGLTPKRYCRVLRFRHVLERLNAEPFGSPVELALGAGYSDQSHFTRDFREFSGVTPGEYTRDPPTLPHHVPLEAPPR